MAAPVILRLCERYTFSMCTIHTRTIYHKANAKYSLFTKSPTVQKILDSDNQPNKQSFPFIRHYSLKDAVETTKKTGIINAVKMQTLKGYFYILKRFENAFELRMPRIFAMYKMFKIGLSDFLVDFKQYYVVCTSIWNGQDLKSFTRKQLETYKQIPGDIRKLMPIYIFTFIPFTIYIALPVAYYFPYKLLSRQFWTPEQLRQFQHDNYIKGKSFYPAVLKDLQKSAHHLEPDQKKLLMRIIQSVKEKNNATADDVLSLRDVFSEPQMRFNKFSYSHLRHISRSLGLKVTGLRKAAQILLAMDHRIVADGLESLADEDLVKACYWRGIDPTDKTRPQQEHLLNQWLQVSQEINDSCLSLLLHTHILLYSHESDLRITRNIVASQSNDMIL